MLTNLIRTLAGVSLFLFLSVFAGVATAQTIGQTSSNVFYGNTGQGQSFTATVTGTVTQIQIRPANTVPNDTLRLYNGSGSGVNSAPGTAAYTQTVSSVATVDDTSPLQTFVLATPFPIVAGNTYTFTFDTTRPRHSSTGGYVGGDFLFFYNFSDPSRDTAFQVVQQAPVVAAIPTMSEWAMIFFGLILAGGAALIVQSRRAAS